MFWQVLHFFIGKNSDKIEIKELKSSTSLQNINQLSKKVRKKSFFDVRKYQSE